VLHERKSRVTLAARLVGKTAAETISAMLAVFARIKPTLRKSILDQMQQVPVRDPARHRFQKFGVRDRPEGRHDRLPISAISRIR